MQEAFCGGHLGDSRSGFIGKSALASLVVHRGHNVVVDGPRLHALIVIGRRAKCTSQQAVRTPRNSRAIKAEADHFRTCSALPGQRNGMLYRGWRHGTWCRHGHGVYRQSNGCFLACIGLAGCGHADLN